MKRALLIAFHFPPFSGSSGIQRTLVFCRYLREFGWDPIVLSAHPRAYPVTREDMLSGIDDDLVVERAFALDAARHLALKGRYVGLSALPDRWSSWWIGGVLKGRSLIRRYRPSVIWSTFPIATAHMIGGSLSRWSGLPLVADFRDAMVVESYPEPPMIEWSYRKVEASTIGTASAAVFTTPSSLNMYRERYSGRAATRFECIRNGYDEESFAAAYALHENRNETQSKSGPLKLLHSGLIKRIERNPEPFLQAIAELRQKRVLSSESVQVVFRAPVNDGELQEVIDRFGLSDIVEIAPAIDYQHALAELLEADGLLLFQAATCNHLVPAKVYEYLRARRPILALTDKAGDTAKILADVGVNSIVDIESKEEIKAFLPKFLDSVRASSAVVPSLSVVQQFSRREQTRDLARLFDDVDNARAVGHAG